MKKIKSVIIGSIFLLILSACNENYTTDNLEDDVITSIEEASREEGIYGVKIKSLDLTDHGNNYYTGKLYTVEEGLDLYYEIEVNTMGVMFEWEFLSDALPISSSSQNTITDKENKASADFCDLSIQELFDYLTGHNFNIEGNGSVSFSKTFDYASNQWKESTITISGNGSTVKGNYSIIGGNTIYIDELIAVSGMFDASRNNGSSGTFTLDCNGNLKGSLTDGNNIKTYTFFPE